MSEFEIVTRSPDETLRLGRELGRRLRGGEVIALDGELGAGKTVLVRGIAEALEVDPDLVYSPSFTLIAEHSGRLPLSHIDLFRLPDSMAPSDGREIGLEEYMEPKGVTAIEWSSRLGGAGLRETIRVRVEVGEGDERTIRAAASGARGEELLRALAAAGLGRLR